MKAILLGPFIPDDGELYTRLGLDRAELKEVVDHWPAFGDRDPESSVCLAIFGCMNEVINGIGMTESEWVQWFSASPEEVAEVYQNWKRLRRRVATGASEDEAS
jgi:hypothetical protein